VAVSEAQAEATVDMAWQHGIRSFDTAPHYGLGLSETRFGTALQGRPRTEFTISTKVGRILEPVESQTGRDDEFDVPATHRRRPDFSADGILRSLESSLARLRLDRVDTIFLHDPDDHLEQAMTEGVATLSRLRDEGTVDRIGVGMNHVAPLLRFAAETPVDVVMVAGRLTLLDQTAAADLLDRCAANGVAVVAAGIFNSGILAQESPSTSDHFAYQAAPGHVVDRARRVQAVCAAHRVSLREAALAYPLAFQAVSQICIGAAHPDEVAQNVTALGQPVPPELWTDLATAGLLDPRAVPPAPNHNPEKERDAQPER
jgi:D-threo-aldose 1-dehydrogenase